MYNDNLIKSLVDYINQNAGYDKSTLKEMVSKKFNLEKKRSVYYCDDFAIHFASSKYDEVSNCLIGLSTLRKYDDKPFIICNVLQDKNELLLANTTCLRQVTHTSKNLRVDNIRGTFLGGDIFREIDGIINTPSNFKKIFEKHEKLRI